MAEASKGGWDACWMTYKQGCSRSGCEAGRGHQGGLSGIAAALCLDKAPSAMP